jgi:hypothetical protein
MVRNGVLQAGIHLAGVLLLVLAVAQDGIAARFVVVGGYRSGHYSPVNTQDGLRNGSGHATRLSGTVCRP